jgi:DNA-binding response OmpR family regulator
VWCKREASGWVLSNIHEYPVEQAINLIAKRETCGCKSGTSMKILIIEDDAEIVEFISIAFSVGLPEVNVISTHEGSAGIGLARTENPDAVILDIGLPDMSGFEVLKQIRAFSKVPIIIESVAASEANIVKGLEWGADEYIVKPFGQFEFLARIKPVLRSPLETTTNSNRIKIKTGGRNVKGG